MLGPNITRLPTAAYLRAEVAITLDDGPDPVVTPQVLDLLDHYKTHATFFCVGKRVTTYPALVQEIIRRGHSVENHSLRHLHGFSLLGPAAMTAEVLGAQHVIEGVTGIAPQFFRAPAGLRNPFIEPILARLGVRLVSWTRRGFDTVATDPDLVTFRLLKGLAPGDILLLHDGRAARTASGNLIIIEVLPRLLQALRSAGLRGVSLKEAFSDCTTTASPVTIDAIVNSQQ
jgi:peptidoglycan/xylan/chitin deacetylase (PgdA/CDA1 family)